MLDWGIGRYGIEEILPYFEHETKALETGVWFSNGEKD
jgi:hypothetical protein